MQAIIIKNTKAKTIIPILSGKTAGINTMYQGQVILPIIFNITSIISTIAKM